jgi:large subunit ribosomal protein L4e
MVNVHSIDGKVKGKMELPKSFSTPYRPDLIQKSVVSLQANVRQTHYTDPMAGLRTSGDYYGSRRHSYRQTINRALSRVPRVKTGGGGLGRVVRVPHAKGGRRAFGGQPRDYTKKINRKEAALALNSAIAATANPEIVGKRGHNVGKITLPLVVEDSMQELKKTRDVLKMLAALGLSEELASRKRRKILIVVSEDNGLVKAASNIEGVDAATVNDLDIELLAPGTQAGRLTVWGESAVKGMN